MGESVDGFDTQPGAQPVHVGEDLAAQRPLARFAAVTDSGLEQVGELVLKRVRLFEFRGKF